MPTNVYTSVPKVFSRDKNLFREMLLNPHARPTRIGVHGDSMCVEGDPGVATHHMNHRRACWHRFFGHTPGTGLTRPNNNGVADAPPDNNYCPWMMESYELIGIADNDIVASSLPPGYNGSPRSVTPVYPYGMGKYFKTTNDRGGIKMRLLHCNQNSISAACGSGSQGFYDVSDFRPDLVAGLGVTAFAAGTMDLGKSLIDASGGITLEVLATRNTASAADLQVYIRPIPDFCAIDDTEANLDAFTMFGGAQSLNGAQGTTYRQQHAITGNLSGAMRIFQAQIAGNTALDDSAAAASIVGARFLSTTNPRGIIMTSWSQGGYKVAGAASLVNDHSNCAHVLVAASDDIYWIPLTINADDTGSTAAQFETDVRAMIAWLRANVGDKPVVLEACPWWYSLASGHTESAQGRMYAGALYNIARDTTVPRTLLVNTRRMSEERYGWGSPANRALGASSPDIGVYVLASDGIHYTNAGSEACARSAVEGTIAYLNTVTGQRGFSIGNAVSTRRQRSQVSQRSNF